jgi:hypothetical protein
LGSLLAPELGRYDEQQAKEHPPLDWLIDHVLAEGAEQAAAIRACIVVRDHHTFLDLAALHKKGCFPHAYPLPLTREGRRAANQREAAVRAADPEGYTRHVLQQPRPTLRQQLLPPDGTCCESSPVGSGGRDGAALGGRRRIAELEVEVRDVSCQLAAVRPLCHCVFRLAGRPYVARIRGSVGCPLPLLQRSQS